MDKCLMPRWMNPTYGEKVYWIDNSVIAIQIQAPKSSLSRQSVLDRTELYIISPPIVYSVSL